jgi:flavin reductase (DIM6/NTAB) family NADH-FMN oxidoreductase RutF
MQKKTSKGYVEYAKLLKKNECFDVLVAPVGEAFRRVFENDPNGLFPELYSPDTYHPSRLGTLLAALVFFGTMTGNMFVPSNTFDPNRARDFDKEMRKRFGEEWSPKVVTPAKFEILRHAADAAIWPGRWDSSVELRSPNLMSRLLYPNPVCMLCTKTLDNKLNVMTVSWLTASDNRGGFVMILNARRFTTKQIRATKSFTLSIPTRGMEHVLINIGSCSGFDVDKTKYVDGWTPVVPGWGSSEEIRERCVSECVAHILASVRNVNDMDNGHVLVTAQCERAFVRAPYWRSDMPYKKNIDDITKSTWVSKATFAPRKSEFRPSPPPILTFLGSKVFGCVDVCV